MSEFFVVTREELERIHSTAFAEGVVFCGEEGPDYDWERFKSDDNSNLSMAACLARPVPEWATHFAEWADCGPMGTNLGRQEEIKK